LRRVFQLGIDFIVTRTASSGKRAYQLLTVTHAYDRDRRAAFLSPKDRRPPKRRIQPASGLAHGSLSTITEMEEFKLGGGDIFKNNLLVELKRLSSHAANQTPHAHTDYEEDDARRGVHQRVGLKL
jgi:hypothetical protein